MVATFFPRPEKGVSIVTKDRTMTEDFQIYFQKLLLMIEALPSVQEDIAALNDLIAAANTAISGLDTATAAVTAQSNLTSSGVTGCTITATDAGADVTIAISAHTRVYTDGSTVAIAGPTTLTGRAYATTYYIIYVDATRADTTPTFQTTTVEVDASQTGDRHLVGVVTTPAAAAPPTNGDEVQLPGLGQLP